MPTDENEKKYENPSEPKSSVDTRHNAVSILFNTAAEELRDFLTETQDKPYDKELLMQRIALNLQAIFFEDLQEITGQQITHEESIPVISVRPDIIALFDNEPPEVEADILKEGKAQAQTMILTKLGVNLSHLTQQMAERTGRMKEEQASGAKSVRTLTLTDRISLPLTQIEFMYVEGENAPHDTLITLLPMSPTQPASERRV